MRWFWVVSLAAARSEPEWDPPPAHAAATCTVEDAYYGQGKLYLDAEGRVFRADSVAYTDDDERYKATYTFGYDDQGRLTSAISPRTEVTYEHSATQVVAHVSTASLESMVSWSLVDGRIVEIDYGGARSAYAYDANGNVTRIVHTSPSRTIDRAYEYDGQGRVVRIQRVGDLLPSGEQRVLDVMYTEAPGELVVDVTRPNDDGTPAGFGHITLVRDDQDRLTTYDFRWTAGDSAEHLHAFEHRADGYVHRFNGDVALSTSGPCPQPELSLVPTPRLETWTSALPRNYFLDRYLLESVENAY